MAIPPEPSSLRDGPRRGEPHVWVPIVVRPALLAAAGRTAEVVPAVEEANAFSWNVDPWLALEVAWRELPAPATDEVRLGAGDYGAARGFSNALRGGRWTRHRAWLRVRPATAAPRLRRHALDGVAGALAPTRRPSSASRPPTDRRAASRSSRAVAPFQVRAAPDAEGVVTVRLDAPTWNRLREPAEQGIRVERMTVSPAVSVRSPPG